jgi:hypothetical protein
MTFNAQNILTTLNRSGLAKLSHYEVEITSPGIDVGNQCSIALERDMMYRAEAAEIPGRTAITTEYKFGNYGPLSKIVYNQLYADMTITFMVSEDLREKEYFEIWQEKMIDTGAFEEAQTGTNRPNSKFNVKYFDDYAGTITLRQYGSAGDLRSIHIFNEAYPIIMQPITVGWNDDGIMKLNVTFAYRNYKVTFRKQEQPRLGIGFGISIGPGGVSGSVRIPGIGTVSSTSKGGLKAVTGKIGAVSAVVAKMRK